MWKNNKNILEENLEFFLFNDLRLEFGATIHAAPGGGMMGFGVTLGPECSHWDLLPSKTSVHSIYFPFKKNLDKCICKLFKS